MTILIFPVYAPYLFPGPSLFGLETNRPLLMHFKTNLIFNRIEHFRTTTFQLLSRAYLSIPPSRAAKYLGLYEDPNTTESENTHPTPPAQQQTPNPESTADNTIDEAQDQDRNQEPKPLSKSEQQVVDEVTSRGWAWDAAQGLLYPRGGAPGSSTARSGREASSMGTGTDGGAGQDRGRGEVVQRMAILAALVVDLGESMIR